MDPWPHFATSRHDRISKALLAVGLLGAGAFTTGVASLLLIMAALVPLGAAVANVSLIRGARDTWRSWHRSFEGSATSDAFRSE